VVVHEDGRHEVHPRNHLKVAVGIGAVALVVWLIGRDAA
jgi:hypothetical protein